MDPVEINAGTWYLRALRADERIDDRPDAGAPAAASTPSVSSPAARPVRRAAPAPAAQRRVRPSRRTRGLLLLGGRLHCSVVENHGYVRLDLDWERVKRGAADATTLNAGTPRR